MILRIDRSVAKSTFKLGRHCGDHRVNTDMKVQIRPMRCQEPPQQYPQYTWPCGMCSSEPEVVPVCGERKKADFVLEYKQFEVSSDGGPVFYWDELLYAQPPGRYLATLLYADGCEAAEFEIEIPRCKATIQAVSNTEANVCQP